MKVFVATALFLFYCLTEILRSTHLARTELTESASAFIIFPGNLKSGKREEERFFAGSPFTLLDRTENYYDNCKMDSRILKDL